MCLWTHLLLVGCERFGITPDTVEKVVRVQRSLHSREDLSEQFVQLTGQAQPIVSPGTVIYGGFVGVLLLMLAAQCVFLTLVSAPNVKQPKPCKSSQVH